MRVHGIYITHSCVRYMYMYCNDKCSPRSFLLPMFVSRITIAGVGRLVANRAITGNGFHIQRSVGEVGYPQLNRDYQIRLLPQPAVPWESFVLVSQTKQARFTLCVWCTVYQSTILSGNVQRP